MMIHNAHDRLLFTPGPLTTSRSVKQAMLRDLGSRDIEFINIIREIREELLRLASTGKEHGHESILMQGSGTYAVEAVIGTTVPAGGKLLVLANGAYGTRMVRMAEILGIPVHSLESPENELPDLECLRDVLKQDVAITHVATVHCETTTGLLNPVEQCGEIVREFGRTFIVDAMSSFGAVPLNLHQTTSIDFLVSSANKCIEGVPGFGFVLARRDALLKAVHARSLSMDLLAQWQGLENNGQFRFTPPTHTLLAFHQALQELKDEGGVDARFERYRSNHRVLCTGMSTMGFTCYLPAELQSPIITSFRYPRHPAFDFEKFYRLLNELGQVIYPGKVSSEDCFRIGTIGRIFPSDVHALLAAVRSVGIESGFMDFNGRIRQEGCV